jgi:hypothetical protein
MNAVAAQVPSIVQGEEGRHPVTQPGQNPQVEIAFMEVKAVDDIRSLRHQLEDVPCAWGVEIVNSPPSVKPMAGMLNIVEQPSQQIDAADFGP